MKKREKPIELLKLEALRGRMVFSFDQERNYKYSLAGFIGECLNDSMAQGMDNHVIRLNDLLLASGGRTCQIDTLFICKGKIYLLEIKNWEGSFEIVDESFVGLSACPLAQLKRTRMILAHFIRSLGIEVEIEGRLIFMNPSITVYGLDRKFPIVFVHQVPIYFRNICRNGTWTNRDKRLGETILKHHITVNPFTKETTYSRESVARGMMCPDCRGKMEESDLVKLHCRSCGRYAIKKDCLAQAKTELDILFGKSVYPRQDLYLWCEGLVSKRMIYDFFRQRS